jgi:hypothetical protein
MVARIELPNRRLVRAVAVFLELLALHMAGEAAQLSRLFDRERTAEEILASLPGQARPKPRYVS